MVGELKKCGVTCVPPPISNQLGPGSLDLRIGKICSFKEPKKIRVCSFDSPPPLKRENLKKGFVINPDETVLVTTMERISLPLPLKVVGWLTNKSSWARKGLSVATQTIDPGHTGNITFLLENLNKFPVKVNKGDRIAQIVLIAAKHNPRSWFKPGMEPFKPDRSGPRFSTLTLGNEFGIFKGPDQVENVIVPQGKKFMIGPGEFVLGITKEEISLESYGFVGMLTHMDTYFFQSIYFSEGLLNPGFKGKIVLEIKNRSDVFVGLSPGAEIYRVFYCPACTFGSYLTSNSRYVGADKTGHPQL